LRPAAKGFPKQKRIAGWFYCAAADTTFLPQKKQALIQARKWPNRATPINLLVDTTCTAAVRPICIVSRVTGCLMTAKQR